MRHVRQAWIWPRDLEEEEIHELWLETKDRYPPWKPGPAYASYVLSDMSRDVDFS